MVLAALDVAQRRLDEGDYAAAESLCRQVLAEQPRKVRALHLLARIARATDRGTLALELLQQVAACASEHAGVQMDLGDALREAGRWDESITAYQRAHALDPRLGAAVTNWAAVLQHTERWEESLPIAQQAAALSPACAIAQYNLGNVLAALGQTRAALAAYTRAVELDPQHAKAQWHAGVCQLLLGEFEQGWDQFEWRTVGSDVHFDRYPQPLWDGGDLTGRTLLVHAEQGIGDEVLFASCLEDVIARAERVVVTCDTRLGALFARSFPRATIVPWQRKKDMSPAALPCAVDAQIPAGSLLRHFRRRREDFPRRRRFLVPDEQRVAAWRTRLAELGPGLKVGLSWRAGGRPSERRRRSIPLAQWRSLLGVGNVQFINLQYGDASAELQAVAEQWSIQIHDPPQGDPLIDIDDYAAKLAALDLVISVGNATVHLAGALGTPVWALLPLLPSWRWQLAGEETPWYESVRLLRQTTRNEWAPLLEQTARRLCFLAGGAPPAAVGTERCCPALPPAALGAAEAQLQSEEDVSTTHARALAAHRAGDLPQAEQLYRNILQLAPRHADSLHGLGVIARKTGRWELAIRSGRRAIAMNPQAGAYHLHLGLSLLESGAPQQAVAALQTAAQLEPQHAPAWLHLGVAVQRCGDRATAERCYLRALELDRAWDVAWLHLARLRQVTGDLAAAAEAYGEALRIAPQSHEAYNGLGTLFLAADRTEEARGCLQRAVQLDPSSAAAWNNLGTACRCLDDLPAATDCYRRAVLLDPQMAGAWANLGSSLSKDGQFAEAADCLRRALQLRPHDADTLDALGTALRDQGLFAQAECTYRQAIELQPDLPGPHANLGLLLLQLGQWQEGWREYDWRWQCESSAPPRKQYQQPLWRGEPLDGRTLLVHGEQGIGDEIMFATCLPEVIRSAGRVIVTCAPRLQRLFARSFPQATFYGVPVGQEHVWQLPIFETAHVQIPAGSLPRYLRNSDAAFPRAAELLRTDPLRAEEFQQALAALGPGLKIGFAWRGGAYRNDQRLRAAPLPDWRELFSVESVHWISLQSGGQDELAAASAQVRRPWHVLPGLDLRDDLDGLAALIRQLDLVISVGNATVHLAGAVGTPTWALIPFARGWRWAQGREDALWYRSVRVFRQQRLGEWGEVFARLRLELLNRQTARDDVEFRRDVPHPHAWTQAATRRTSAR